MVFCLKPFKRAPPRPPPPRPNRVKGLFNPCANILYEFCQKSFNCKQNLVPKVVVSKLYKKTFLQCMYVCLH